MIPNGLKKKCQKCFEKYYQEAGCFSHTKNKTNFKFQMSDPIQNHASTTYIVKITYYLNNKLVTDEYFIKCPAIHKIEKEKIRNEIDMHKLLTHDNTVKYFFYFNFEDKYYLALEKLFYSLRILITRNLSRNLNFLRIIMYQLLEGLKHFHSKSITHRDLKPENIMVSSKAVWKIIDYGDCKKLNNGSSTYLTTTGTPSYQSPEIIMHDSYTTKTDIWSLGIIALEASGLCAQYNIVLPRTNNSPVENNQRKKYIESIVNQLVFLDEEENLFMEFLKQCLKFESTERMCSIDLLKLDWFWVCRQMQNNKELKSNSLRFLNDIVNPK